MKAAVAPGADAAAGMAADMASVTAGGALSPDLAVTVLWEGVRDMLQDMQWVWHLKTPQGESVCVCVCVGGPGVESIPELEHSKPTE